MIELYLSKVTESSESEQAGKLYARVSARVSYKQAMDIHDMAHHMAEHNTAFSEGLIVGVLTDFVKCTREMVLSGNTVKVGNLAIFKATVEANALDTLYDAEQDKVASATIGTLAEGQKTGPAVRVVKLLAQGGEAVGPEHGRLYPRGAEEGREAQLDRQDEGRDCRSQGRSGRHGDWRQRRFIGQRRHRLGLDRRWRWQA